MNSSMPGFPLSLTISQSLPKFMSTDLVMLSNHLVPSNHLVIEFSAALLAALSTP